MDFRILGPLEVLDEGRGLPVAGRSQRTLLALLLVHANQTLGTDRLIDDLWGEHPPAGAAKTILVRISRLRAALGRGHETEGALVTRERGYCLQIDPEHLDARRFERLVAQGGRDLDAGRLDQAADALESALALWRGAPLTDVAYEPFAQAEIARLNELRASALEQQIELDLLRGRHADVVGRLPGLIAAHPYREHLRAQLMLALYRCDRQADALQAYQDARRVLVDELGIEPGEHLRRLERDILAQDRALWLADGRPASPAAGRAAGEGGEAPAAGARRLATVVVVNAAAPREPAAPLDPESLHDAVDRRAKACTDVLGRHGGTVEKSAGDTVVGLFGLRSLHEDDALRAVRAALELHAAFADDGIAVTIGLDSGEVFVGAGARGETFAAGEVMNVAARLAARDGPIVLGEGTYRLVAQHVQVDPVEPPAARGRLAGVRAFRLVGLRSGESPPPATPFVGRERERATLRELLGAVKRERSCRLVTVVGPPGIGKSRLARELIADVSGEAAVAVGRCLSYGDGITYRPLAEIVEQLTGGEPERGLAALLETEDEADSIARHVLGAIGVAAESAQAIETFWAVRRLFEASARERPLVLIVEDVHWAEPTLLDLIEYVVAFSSGAPILLLCLARPELLESRPAWAAPQPASSLLALEALSDAEAQDFVETLAHDEPGSRATARIVATAEGNPLFLEQLVAVRAEQGLVTLPPSIEAVLAARIDRLAPAERAVLVHASVEGRSFHRGGLAALMPDEAPDAVAVSLVALVRKQLIRPDRSEFAGDDAFRFAHALIREAAYCGMPKRVRADLHERVAGWLKTRSHVRDETLGYHLEQAFGLRREIGATAERDRALAAEAVDRLSTAARAALVRGDAAAGARLLERAAALLDQDDPARTELLCALGSALIEVGRLEEAGPLLTAAIERAELEGDARLESRARVDQQHLRLHEGTIGGHDEARAVVLAALRELEAHGDDVGQCRGWQLHALLDWIECASARADEAWKRAAIHARRARDERELYEILGWRASAAVFGPTPVPVAIRRCAHIREQVRNSPVAVALTLHPLGLLHAMTGDFELARRLVRERNEIVDQLGRMESAVSHHEALVEMLAGQPERAEARLRPAYDTLERMGAGELLATTAAMLAQAVYAQDRTREAEELSRLAERIGTPEDVATQVMWRGVRARILAGREEREEAQRLVREAVALAGATDLLVLHADALMDLEEVARLAGRRDEARAAALGALELYERKGDLVSIARTRTRLTALSPGRSVASIPRP